MGHLEQLSVHDANHPMFDIGNSVERVNPFFRQRVIGNRVDGEVPAASSIFARS
jgi:hypothetical protein